MSKLMEENRIGSHELVYLIFGNKARFYLLCNKRNAMEHHKNKIIPAQTWRWKGK